MNTMLDNLLDRRANFLSFVQRRVGDRSLAEDILQSAYVRALERSGTVREPESAMAWFYSVLRNAVIDHFRSRASESGALDRWASELETAQSQSGPPDAFTRDLVCGCIEHILPTLRPAYAEALREVDLAEQPLAEFAAHHGITSGNAAVRVHRARAALRRELARVCGACSLHACLNCTCKRATVHSGATRPARTSSPHPARSSPSTAPPQRFALSIARRPPRNRSSSASACAKPDLRIARSASATRPSPAPPSPSR
jgi:RNA polymerase sigma-70 factor (ECF subfamily)